MIIRPCELRVANEFVSALHRHHKPVVGHRFSISIWNEDETAMHGVAICGRPVSRHSDQRLTLEITRCCTDGQKNAISQLYGAVCRAAKAMGFKCVQTYTLPEEGGASMRASGFKHVHTTVGGSWGNRPSRREDQPQGPKWRWERIL